MSTDDRMLDGAGAARRGFLPYQGGYVNVPETIEKATSLQQAAMSAKLAGDHTLAVTLYRRLLPIVKILDKLEVLDMPYGMPTQLVMRAIELEEQGGLPPIVTAEPCSTSSSH